MVAPLTAKGTKLNVALGDGEDPEVFTAFCAVSAKTINFQTNTNEFFVPDCDDPDDPAWRELAKSGRFVSISCSGTLNTTDLTRYQDAYNSPDAVNVEIELDLPLAAGGGVWSGPFMLPNFQITGNDGELVQVEFSLESSGAVTWTDAAA